MRLRVSYQWLMIPVNSFDNERKHRVNFVLILVPELPALKNAIDVYGIGLKVELVRTLELN